MVSMTESAKKSPTVTAPVAPQLTASDDLGYEYTLEHWLEVRELVLAAEKDVPGRCLPAPSSAAKASAA
jgi:hypothetical protein